MYPDLLFYYGIDLVAVIEGRGPSPALVHSLIARLPDTSMTHALASGGVEHLGWGMDRHLAAETYDAINQNTRATGNWGKKAPPKIDPFPRPKRKGGNKKATSVKDIFQRFQGKGR